MIAIQSDFISATNNLSHEPDSHLTIFSAPKKFTDPHINIIQRNAIQSWQSLGPEVDVILVGEEDRMAEVADEYE